MLSRARAADSTAALASGVAAATDEWGLNARRVLTSALGFCMAAASASAHAFRARDARGRCRGAGVSPPERGCARPARPRGHRGDPPSARDPREVWVREPRQRADLAFARAVYPSWNGPDSLVLH